MDAKSKANFINSVADGQTIPCPKCNTANKPGTEVCVTCGTRLIKADTDDSPAFAPVSESYQHTAKGEDKYMEDKSVFADGLPAWDIVPPQVMVRRR